MVSGIKYKGVYYNKRRMKWIARIRVDRKYIHLGYFDNATEASIAYDKAILTR